MSTIPKREIIPITKITYRVNLINNGKSICEWNSIRLCNMKVNMNLKVSMKMNRNMKVNMNTNINMKGTKKINMKVNMNTNVNMKRNMNMKVNRNLKQKWKENVVSCMRFN